jgi:hypothetical protein
MRHLTTLLKLDRYEKRARARRDRAVLLIIPADAEVVELGDAAVIKYLPP